MHLNLVISLPISELANKVFAFVSIISAIEKEFIKHIALIFFRSVKSMLSLNFLRDNHRHGRTHAHNFSYPNIISGNFTVVVYAISPHLLHLCSWVFWLIDSSIKVITGLHQKNIQNNVFKLSNIISQCL